MTPFRSQAQPAVTGKRIAMPSSRGRPAIMGVFSCHWAAVAALVRLRQPDFKSIGGDLPADLHEEAVMRVRIENWRRGER